MKHVLLSLIVALAFTGGGVAAMSKIVAESPTIVAVGLSGR
jgi:hypothetical protein